MPTEEETLNNLARCGIEQFVAKFTIPIMYEFAGGDAEKVEKLTKDWTFLTLDQVGRPTAEERYFLAGYPTALVRQGSDYYSGPLYILGTVRLPETPADARAPIDQKFDLFFNYDTHAKISGTETFAETPRLPGASGGSLCQLVLTDDPLWAPSKALKIVAIQSSAAKDRTWFRAKSWLGVAELLRRKDAQLAEKNDKRLSAK